MELTLLEFDIKSVLMGFLHDKMDVEDVLGFGLRVDEELDDDKLVEIFRKGDWRRLGSLPRGW
jgi:hypothetical protein